MFPLKFWNKNAENKAVVYKYKSIIVKERSDVFDKIKVQNVVK